MERITTVLVGLFFILLVVSCSPSGHVLSDREMNEIASDYAARKAADDYRQSKWDEVASADATSEALVDLLQCGDNPDATRAEYQACIDRIKQRGNPAYQTAPARCVSWRDAAKYTGLDTCITGIVYSTYNDPQSSAFFIDFDNSRSSFYGVSFKWIWNGLKGRCVELLGTVSTYNGRPQIIIDREEQLQPCSE